MSRGGSSGFHTTRWSLIAALPPGGGDAADARAREALAHLCATYWRPLYAFARLSGRSAADAQDLTQAFLARVVESGGLGGADPDRGRFRSYLLGAMKHFMANERERARAKKRGGDRRIVAGDVSEMESWLSASETDGTAGAADRAFDRSWAEQITAEALDRLETEWADRGRAAAFEALRPALAGEVPDRSGTAERLGMTDNAIGVAVHRLRQRYAALVREAVAMTVADDAEVEDEIRYLLEVLREK